MNLARPNLFLQFRYGHKRALLTHIYWVYLAWAKHYKSIYLDKPNFSGYIYYI